jgi:hypothetical protein
MFTSMTTTIRKTIEIPPDRHLSFDLPETAPVGKVTMMLYLVEHGEPGQPDTGPFPSIDELKKEARQKTADRFADPSGDSLQKYCGSLQNIFNEDGVTIQRKIRDEWPD